MGYVTLYRKWRPQTFEDVVGQEHIVRTLTNALRDNRVAHAYLFSGPRGTGKTSIAKILAKALNCADGPTPTPCNQCAVCGEITAGSGLDVIEIDAASNRGIDEIRDIREKVKFMPAGGGTKVYIIDEVHMLTPEAFNALLKMLEEPPAHVVFILATTEPHKVLPTILSRCQRFDFRRLKTGELAGRLKEIAAAEGIDIDETSIAMIAKQAKGGMRDAVSTLDQLSSYTGSVIRMDDVMAMLGMVDSNLLFRVADIIRERKAGAALVFVNEIVESGWDLRQFAKDLTEHFRNLFVIRNTDDPGDGVIATAEELTRLEAQASGFDQVGLVTALDALTGLNNDMRFAADPRLVLELALVKMTARPEAQKSRSAEEQKQEAHKAEEQKAQGQKTGTQNVEAQKTVPEKPSGNELETIKRAWPAVLESIKKTKMSVFANLLECQPIALEGTAVVLGFHDRAGGHMERISSEANKSFVEKVLRDITGKPYTVNCVISGKQEPEAPDSREPRAASREAAPKPKPDSRHSVIARSEATKQTHAGASPDEDIPPLPTSEGDSGEVAEPVQSEAKDLTEGSSPAVRQAGNDVERSDAERSVPAGDDMVATIAGLFDATVKETKERDNES